MKNIIKVGTGDLGTCIQLCPDGISIISLLSSGRSSSIQIFGGNLVNFEVFSNHVIPIKGRIWIFSYKEV